MATPRKNNGRKKTTTIVETLPPSEESENGEDTTEFDIALESAEDIETLREITENFGVTGTTLKVYRITPGGAEFCYQTDNVDEEFIQKNFGGGDFSFRIFINGKFKRTIKQKIAPRVTAETGTTETGGHAAFLEKMLLAILPAMIAQRNDSVNGPSITELTTALSNLDSLRGKQESTMDLFLKGVTFAKETMKDSGGTGDWKSELISAGKEAIPVIANMIPNLIPNSQQPMPTQQQVNGNGNHQPNQISDQQRVAMLKQGLDYLKKKCISGLQPEFIVEWVENNAEDYQSLIGEILNTPFEDFVKIDAEIGREPFKPWFTDLFNRFRSSFAAVNTVDVDSTGEPGDSPDDGDNVEPSKGSKRKGA